MPFLAAVKEAKLRTFVDARAESHRRSQSCVHDGSGYAMTEAQHHHATASPFATPRITFRVLEFPNADIRRRDAQARRAIGLPSSEALADG